MFKIKVTRLERKPTELCCRLDNNVSEVFNEIKPDGIITLIIIIAKNKNIMPSMVRIGIATSIGSKLQIARGKYLLKNAKPPKNISGAITMGINKDITYIFYFHRT